MIAYQLGAFSVYRVINVTCDIWFEIVRLDQCYKWCKIFSSAINSWSTNELRIDNNLVCNTQMVLAQCLARFSKRICGMNTGRPYLRVKRVRILINHQAELHIGIESEPIYHFIKSFSLENFYCTSCNRSS